MVMHNFIGKKLNNLCIAFVLALSMSDEIGNFVVGKAFDALHIDIAATGSPMHLFPGETLDDMFQKFVMLGDDRNIVQVFVDGRKVKMTL